MATGMTPCAFRYGRSGKRVGIFLGRATPTVGLVGFRFKLPLFVWGAIKGVFVAAKPLQKPLGG